MRWTTKIVNPYCDRVNSPVIFIELTDNDMPAYAHAHESPWGPKVCYGNIYTNTEEL